MVDFIHDILIVSPMNDCWYTYFIITSHFSTRPIISFLKHSYMLYQYIFHFPNIQQLSSQVLLSLHLTHVSYCFWTIHSKCMNQVTIKALIRASNLNLNIRIATLQGIFYHYNTTWLRYVHKWTSNSSNIAL